MAATTAHDAEQANDRRYMAAAIRLARKHAGLTSTNPSVGTLIVRDDGDGPVIVGRGVTDIGGRPHAETEALAQAGARARGATAYVTLEPCAHHGRTPPCASALVSAGVARVVGAASDPDSRVSGKGYAILRDAGIEVVEGVLAAEAADAMAGYLIRSLRKRPEVILKLALSVDGMIGKPGEGQIAITGAVARRQVHLMRAAVDAVIIGIGTALEDDPELTVRLPGLSARSPARIVLDRQARLPADSKLARSARAVPLLIAACAEADAARKAELERTGARMLATETYDDRVALPELLEDLAAQGMSSVLVEGGAATARHFLEEGLVDRIALFSGAVVIGEGGLAAPIDASRMPPGFELVREASFGDDRYQEWTRAI
ncbi:MAG: bifunctional diaminohydroxyphosphoribosylaminopyrimidine deaminase/5-amino-6-(5-phosphoribosylamino)uracil reductase RibD [Alphaproteobacteria bacterium]|jgi:diaminohydroxyphosphoribosylaminopyrimidine deaminase / 5-amino-6-(5-phosphoribosylamino)uracil reductase|nr:bifunctional diaminohydroxyphosphoribosylaminopyrimidine deaminase/5-amino-6-(5-phosphoribosylamino)uracil reductase RibD [Alphaproteobacteria bacterium]MBU0806180.1 bifunctional diaminohydroxyphosphoribosylaminopyrimidine deaminase/5-amino-6-(5-phosphoribosylamino)uracil reductase RibD [Alphaproteobacteria bacterium]MBU0874261.1 bifunctional diaminohydroxyphosphoribosylaminopyrimidine deaminase/5-amino-6-(5-phosphoribosylamino)uracil reductase RibD [Alphaproteobacteria bacterium]MBU1400488.1